ncbi:MAG: hypothetical protein WCA41_08005, partial [Candidatus Acidiferrum sp.]
VQEAEVGRPHFTSNAAASLTLLVSAVGASRVNPARKGWEASNSKPEHRRCGTNPPPPKHL